MALQVWLPLNKDLINQGLSNISINDIGTAIDNNGKIGKCFKITAEKSLGYTPNFNDKGLSLCGWFKFNQSEINAITSTQTYDSTWNSCTGNLIGNNYYGGIGLIWQTNNIYSSGSLTSITIRSILRTPTFYKMTSGFNVEFDKWIHIILTWDPNTHVLSLYKDGVLFNSVSNIASFTDGVSRVLSISYKGAWGGNPRTPVIPIYENDIRIYDHCLSPKEVKEISKGLVLHYTLDDYSRNTLLPPGVELYDYILSSGTLWIDTEVICNNGISTYLDFQCTVGHSNYSKIMGYATSTSWTPYGFGTRTGTNGAFARWGNGTLTMSSTTFTTDRVNATFLSNSTSNNGNIAIFDIAGPSGANYPRLYMKVFLCRITNSNNLLICNMLPCTYLGEPGMWDTVENKFYKNLGTGQFILGNKIATTYNDNIIYDCSGYLNNGNITGNLTIISDSPRYATSVSVDSSEFTRITKQNLSLPDGPITLSFWSKPEVNTRVDDSKIIITFGKCYFFTYINYPYFLHGEDYYYKYTNYWSDGNWHLITCTYDGTLSKMYIDGILISPNHTTTTVTYSDNLILKLRKNSMSDFRIYATALSDEDIKELYDTSAIIDNLNNLHTRELIEDNMDYVEISKKGIVKTDSLTEGNNGVIFSSDNIECNQLIEI